MRILPLGHALSVFLALTFTICALWGLATPTDLHMHAVWQPLLSGFQWISFPAYLIGHFETYFYGSYAAALFVPLYNFFSKGDAS